MARYGAPEHCVSQTRKKGVGMKIEKHAWLKHMDNFLVVLKTFIVVAVWWVLRAAVIAIPFLGIVLLIFPGLQADLNSAGWNRLAFLAAWIVEHYPDSTHKCIA